MKDYVGKYPQAITARDQLQYAHAELPGEEHHRGQARHRHRAPDSADDHQPVGPILAEGQKRWTRS